jgi:hypothetical protein
MHIDSVKINLLVRRHQQGKHQATDGIQVETAMKPDMTYSIESNPVFFLVLIAAAFAAYPASAGQSVSLEGSLKGASCVHFKMDCPDDEAHIAMEHDFVLFLPDGKHYFLPNLSRATKARFANQPVRVSGELEEHSIWVDTLEVKKDGKLTTVWSWKQQLEKYKGGGG